MTLVRHLLAILALPTTVTVIVPWWLVHAEWPVPRSLSLATEVRLALGMAGAAVGMLGLVLFVWCVMLFARIGRGTLAPWDPTKQLVVVGPYRHVRNPMISAVACILAAEALVLVSQRLAAWALLFVAINHLYFVTVEEPGLRRRFGVEYEAYQSSVPRWVPRRHAWPAHSGGR